MKTRPAAKGSKKTRKEADPIVHRPNEETGKSPGRDPGERGDRDAIGRPVQLGDTEIDRPVQLGGVTEDTPDEEGGGGGTQRRQRDADEVDRERR